MSDKRLTLRKLHMLGTNRPVAEVSFSPGLNVIAGAERVNRFETRMALSDIAG